MLISHTDDISYSPRRVHKRRLAADFEYLAAELRPLLAHPACLADCPAMDALPTQRRLRELSRHDLDAAISIHGGYVRVAQQLGLRAHFSRVKGYWQDAGNVLEEVRAFCRSEGLAEAECPSYALLERAGRHDLKHGIESLGGRKAIANLLLQQQQRHRPPLSRPRAPSR